MGGAKRVLTEEEKILIKHLYLENKTIEQIGRIIKTRNGRVRDVLNYYFPNIPNLENEEWRDVVGWEGYYQVSNMGRIKCLTREIFRKGRTCTYKTTAKESLLKLMTDKYGYLKVTLTKEKFVKTFFVHRLVGEAFIPNPENKKTINHKKGLVWDNRVSELEWMTQGENLSHSCRELRQRGRNSKLTVEQVREIRNNQVEVSTKILSEMYGVKFSVIQRIKNGTTYVYV